MSYYEGLSFFVCLVIVLLVAIVIGALEKPLKWYSLLVSLLFVAFVFAGRNLSCSGATLPCTARDVQGDAAVSPEYFWICRDFLSDVPRGADDH